MKPAAIRDCPRCGRVEFGVKADGLGYLSWASPKQLCEDCRRWGQTTEEAHSPKAAVDLKPDAPGPKSVKAPMHALPLTKLEGLARVLEYGNQKYARDNWVGTAKNPDLYIGAALRHLAAIRRGEFIDPESGLPHVWHLQASTLILAEALENSGAYKWAP